MDRQITIHDVAKKAGYSITVISHALNDNPRINQKTARKIKKIARALGYKPNIFARSFVRQKSEMIGVVVPGIMTSFYPEVIQGIKEKLLGNGYGFILGISDDKGSEERKSIEFLRQRQVDGLIIAPCQDGRNKACYQLLIEQKTPLVFIDRFLPELNASTVVTDNIEGGYLATKHLLELGHRRIGLFRATFSCSTTSERIRGYKNALREFNVPFDSRLIKTSPYNIGGNSYKVNTDIVTSYLRAKIPPTAIFVIHDVMAVSILSTLLKSGIRIPQDISIIGYDDLAVVSHLPVPLSSVSQPKLEIGSVAAEILIKQIKDGKTGVEHIRLKPKLIVRVSCRNLGVGREA